MSRKLRKLRKLRCRNLARSAIKLLPQIIADHWIPYDDSMITL